MMIQNVHVCDPIPQLETGVIVTPLMVACYLGDEKAAGAIIPLFESKRWTEAVLATTRQGEDCLDLAMESLDIAEELHGESMEQLKGIATKKDRAKQEKIVEQCKMNLEMATNLVERIRSLKNFALEKKKESHSRRNVTLTLIVIASILIGTAFRVLHPWFCILLLFVSQIIVRIMVDEDSKRVLAEENYHL